MRLPSGNKGVNREPGTDDWYTRSEDRVHQDVMQEAHAQEPPGERSVQTGKKHDRPRSGSATWPL